MNTPRIVGIVCVVVGISLIVIGFNSSNSIADQVHETFTGRFTQATTWYIVGGIAATVVGAVLGGFYGRMSKVARV